MKFLLKVILLLFFACNAFAEQGRIAVIKSSSAAPYEAAIAGLREELSRAGITSVVDEYDIPFNFHPPQSLR